MTKKKLKGATLTIIKSENGGIFGGYTECQWDRNHGSYIGDKNKESSFIFSLKKVNENENQSNFIKYNKNITNTTGDIYSTSSYGPTFGGGHNIKVYDNANTGNHCYDRASESYYERGTFENGKYGYLSGEPNQTYNIQNYEVFQVIKY